MIISSIALASLALTLTACMGDYFFPEETPSLIATSSSTTATPAPTSTTVAAPTSQGQALKEGLAAVQRYDTVLSELINAKSTDTSRLDALPRGPLWTGPKGS